MAKILLTNVTFCYDKYYSPIFSNVTLSIDTSWKLGLIGRNGRGKTTLLRIINGDITPQSGEIKKGIDTDFFPYCYEGDIESTLNVIKECIGKLYTMEKSLNDAEVLEHYMQLDGFAMEGKIKKEAKKIGLKEGVLERKFIELSSGERTKAMIIALFLKTDNFILLDEPTNHLDEKGKRELAGYLKTKKGFIVVSHDSFFLDAVVDHVLSIRKCNIEIEKGNYSSWEHNVGLIEEYEKKIKENLTKEITKLERQVIKNREWASVSNSQHYHFVSHSRANGAQTYYGQAKRAKLKINNDINKKKNLLKNYEEAKRLDIMQDRSDEEWLIKINNLNFSYIESEQLLCNISLIIQKHDKLWIRGANGSGKSTLLKLITGEIPNPCITYSGKVVFTVLQQQVNLDKWEKGSDYLSDMLEEEYHESIPICEMLEITNEMLEKPCSTYSSGEMKKIYLAGILSKKTILSFWMNR